MARTKSSGRWLNEHFKDEFVKRAQREGYRSRAVYKLDEIQKKDKLIRPGITVVDLGAAPGSWAQYAGKITGAKGRVMAIDLLKIEPIESVEILQGDFREQEVLDQLLGLLNGQKADLVISDMAPNISGMSAVDQPRGMHLCELALEFALENLVFEGDFLVKVFQGEGFDEYVKELKKHFKKVIFRKPRASRPRSREVYVLCRSLMGSA